LIAAWTWTFFSLHQPDIALSDIGLVWVTILTTLILFWQFVPLPGILLLPYLAWVSFATVLTWTIWPMNQS